MSSSTVEKHFEKLRAEAIEHLDRKRPGGVTRIQVGSATCENAAGADDVADEFEKHIEASGRDDVLLERRGCTGNCGEEPVVGVFIPGKPPVNYGNVTREAAHEIFTSHIQHDRIATQWALQTQDSTSEPPFRIHVCGGERCIHKLDWNVQEKLQEALKAYEEPLASTLVFSANCFGLCSTESAEKVGYVLVSPDNIMYRVQSPEDVDKIVTQHLVGGTPVEELKSSERSATQRFSEIYGDVAYLHAQTRVALRNCGVIHPESLNDYLSVDGFRALSRVLQDEDADSVIEKMSEAKIRGRGGGGFQTAKKWRFATLEKDQERYFVCNADEGDPGAFMDRDMLESDPFNVIEGMIIGAYTIGAKQGYFYIRAEYPLAIQRLEYALQQCREHGLLGENILGSDFSFDIELRLGAGAFVCGEETALIHSIEGERGQPRIRPPYPTESGLWGHPTVINNVETLANVPAIILYGADWFERIGSQASGGTKVFALAGKVKKTGLVEVPMGTRLSDVVYTIGGGVAGEKALKAVQTGGPAGGCIPAEACDTLIDFDTLQAQGSIMGSGGMIVLAEDDCMVDVAKFFLQFTQDESCGKCTPCREGTKRMLEILTRMTSGTAEAGDVDKLERLALLVQKSSLCGLGRAAPTPVLSTLKYFREEYKAHVEDKTCPAKRCTSLIRYEIDPDKCVGCTLCARNCPVSCISGERRETHEIDQTRCIKCGRCFEVCRFDAVRLI